MAALTMHPTMPNCHPISLCAALAWRGLRNGIEMPAGDSVALDLVAHSSAPFGPQPAIRCASQIRHGPSPPTAAVSVPIHRPGSAL
jgi:hypothetical protein